MLIKKQLVENLLCILNPKKKTLPVPHIFVSVVLQFILVVSI